MAERTTLTPGGVGHGAGHGGEAGVPVMQDELHAHPCIFQVHQEVPALLHYPGLGWVRRGAQDPDPAGAVLNHGQDADLRAVEQAGGEEVRVSLPCSPGSPVRRPGTRTGCQARPGPRS